METIDQIDLRSLRLFEAVARRKSFAEGGRELGIPRANASKIISDLEETLGGKLFQRTTRQVGLTELGEHVLNRSTEHVLALRETLSQAKLASGDIAGVIRLSVSHAYGRYFILSKLQKFQVQYPRVQFELILSDAIDDLILKTLDFSIRLGPLPDTSMIARGLASLDVVLAASTHLAKPLSSIEDTASLPMIGFRVPGSGAKVPWVFSKDGTRHIIETDLATITANSIEAVADLVKAGAGVAPVPKFLIQSELTSGALTQLWPDYRFSEIPVNICFTERALMPKRVRLLIDYLASP
jgi:LysR family transcriptional regulator, regulator for bpeEF and oprC